MEELFIKACKVKDIQYVKYWLDMYIANINYIKRENEQYDIIDNIDDIDSYDIINKINKNIYDIKLQIRTEALKNAVRDGNIEVVKCLLENKNRYTEVEIFDNKKILCSLCYNGHLEIIKYILQNNKHIDNISWDNGYILFVAYHFEYIDIVKYLIEYSEEVNIKFHLNSRDYYRLVNSYNYNLVKYILYLRKHNYNSNYDKYKYNIPAYIELFNCKYININFSIDKSKYTCIYNNIIMYILRGESIPNKYYEYCIFINTNI